MELTELAGENGFPEEALEAWQGPFLAKLSMVETLNIDLDREGCQALLEQMGAQAKPGNPLVEMRALRTLRVAGSLRQWQRLDAATLRLFHIFRPQVLEELEIIGVDQMKAARALLGHAGLAGTLRRLRLGLNGFHFLAQEDLMALGPRLAGLRSLRLFGVSPNGPTCRESICRMFICAGAFLEYIGQIPAPEEVEVLHISNASILGDDHQIASVLRGLASFGQLRVVKLPLPSLPLSLREVLSLRFALPRLLFFLAEPECVEGADEWPDGEDWPPMTQIWPLCETLTPLSVFAREFPDHLSGPGQAAEEWARLSEEEQHYYAEAVPLFRQAYRRCERGHNGGAPPESPSDTSGRAAGAGLFIATREEEGEAAQTWRAEPDAREPTVGECISMGVDGDEACDARRAMTHGLEDWRAEERSALRGVLQMKASDVCKDKARLRRDHKPARGSEGQELFVAARDDAGRSARAEEDLDSPREAAGELHADRPQRCCPREQAGAELGDDSAAASEL